MPISKRRPVRHPAGGSLAAAFAAALAPILAFAALPAQAVVGGTEAPAGGAVMVLSSKGGVCTGVVLAPDTVLTAGHCLADAREHRVHFRDAAGERSSSTSPRRRCIRATRPARPRPGGAPSTSRCCAPRRRCRPASRP